MVSDEDSLFDAPPMGEQERMVEAILFASAEPVTLAELEARMPHGADPAEALVHLKRRYEGRGVNLVRVGDAYAMRTAADLGFLMRRETVETRKLSRAAIETLAIIAYHQPVTRTEIEEIRGVAVSTNIVKTLLEREWVRVVGHRDVPGRPSLYATTRKFLDYFGLKSLNELPTLAELREPEFLGDDLPLELPAAPQQPGLAHPDSLPPQPSPSASLT